MIAFLVSLASLFMAPVGHAAVAAASAPPPVAASAPPPVAASAAPHLGWLGGTWRYNGLEMVCKPSATAMACREEGKSGPLKGSSADLTFARQGSASQLTLALPSVPAMTFTQVGKDRQSATFEMKSPNGVARLRFTRTGDVLKVDRGSGDNWATSLAYQRAG